MQKGAQQPIIIKKGKGYGHGHHGGSWKVALADFMTAMMAFFMLMWLLGSTSEEEQRAISGYFNDPGSEYTVGAGGASPGVIQMEDPQRESHAEEETDDGSDRDDSKDNTQEGNAQHISDAKVKKEMERIEKEQLEELQQELQTQINEDTVFQQIKDQILIDQTALGLRIQIVDKDQRPSFDVGSARMKPYTEEVLKALAPLLDKVKNKISVTGHTDSTPYGAGATYTNWELSADRANAARRALLEGTFPNEKVATVQGMSSAAPLVVDKPDAPINRRIAIIVLKKAVGDALSNGGAGLTSGDLINPSGDSSESQPRLLTPKEIDSAIDTTP